MSDDALQSFERLLEGRAPQAAIGNLAAYGALLERWSRHHSLVRVAGREELVERHLLESLAPIDRLPSAGRLVDVGSGAGLPGVPLLCALSGWSGVLIEPRRKRETFLKLVIRELGLDAEVAPCRFEEFEGGGFDLVTSRALGGVEALLRWAEHRLTPGGRVAIWGTVDDLPALGGLSGWTVVSSPLPGLIRGRLILLSTEGVFR